MDQNALISVIVPVYNVERYLPECVESLRAQTYANLEILLVDDGSPDRCGAICDEYAAKDSRIKVIHKPNGGLSSARNAGLDIARGDYIGFVDSDDYVKPEMYARMISAAESHSAEVCVCRGITQDERGRFGNASPSECEEPVVFSGTQMLERLVYTGMPKYVVAWNKLIAAPILEKIRFAEGKRHEDDFFVHQLYGACKKTVIIDDVLYVYRIRSDSIMHERITVKRLDAVEALIERIRYLCLRGNRELAIFILSAASAQFVGICAQLTKQSADDKERIAGLEKELWRAYREIPDLSRKEKTGLAVKLGLMKPRIAAKRIITMASSARKR
jgi:glycosyltransferase involved in cell wall biosynthesis